MVEGLAKELEQIKITKCVKIFDDENNRINAIAKLNDDRIILISKDHTVKIVDPLNNFNYDFTGKLENDNQIHEIISLSNGHIVVSFSINLMEIYSFGKNELKKEFSTTATGNYTIMTALTKNRFASLGTEDKKIKIWKADVPYSDTLIVELAIEDKYNSKLCLTQLKDKEVLVYAGYDVYLWDLNDYKCIKVIKEFSPGSFFIQITEDIFASNGNIINIKTGEKEEYFRAWFTDVYSGLLLSNGKMLFGTTYENIDHGWTRDSMNLYDFKLKDYSGNTVEDNLYCRPLSIDNHTFVTLNKNNLNVWKY